jgi:hypothetical protein
MTHMGAEDPYYQWWVAPPLRGGEGALCGRHIYHLCRVDCLECSAKNGANEVIHLSVWRSLSWDEALIKLVRWKAGDSSGCLPEDLEPSDDLSSFGDALLVEKPQGRFRPLEGSGVAGPSKPSVRKPSLRLIPAKKLRREIAEAADDEEEDEASGCGSDGSALDSELRSLLQPDRKGSAKLAQLLKLIRSHVTGQSDRDDASEKGTQRRLEGAGELLSSRGRKGFTNLQPRMDPERPSGDSLGFKDLKEGAGAGNDEEASNDGPRDRSDYLLGRRRAFKNVAKEADSLCGQDRLMQRFKAINVAILNHSWRRARWLELIPTEADWASTTIDEDELILQVERVELKIRGLITQLRESG